MNYIAVNLYRCSDTTATRTKTVSECLITTLRRLKIENLWGCMPQDPSLEDCRLCPQDPKLEIEKPLDRQTNSSAKVSFSTKTMHLSQHTIIIVVVLQGFSYMIFTLGGKPSCDSKLKCVSRRCAKHACCTIDFCWNNSVNIFFPSGGGTRKFSGVVEFDPVFDSDAILGSTGLIFHI